MRRPIFVKILTGFLIVTVTLAILILVISYDNIKSHYIKTTAQNLENIGFPLQQVILPIFIKKDDTSLETMARWYGHQLNIRITIIDSSGNVHADSERDPSTMENHHDRPEVKQALDGSVGQSIRYSTTLEQDLLYIALPLKEHGRISGVLRLSMALKHISDLLSTLLTRLIWLTFIIMMLSLAISALFSHLLSTPIRALSKAAGKVAKGEFTVRVPPGGNDEIRDLTESFNEMAQRLEASFHELNARKEELESIVASITEALLVLDGEGKVTLFNAAASKIIDAEVIIGRYYWEILRSPKLNTLLEDAIHGPASGEVDLATRTYLCSITPLITKQATVMILHDITEMKQLQHIKHDLAVNVSHELRTPLTAIKGFTETLLDEANPTSQEYLKIIQRHTERLIAMVNDLLILSEMEEKPELVLEDVNLYDLITRLVAIYEQRIKEKGLTVNVRCPSITIKADLFKLEQLLTNLIDNAMKYTEKGEISISAELKGDHVTLIVKDTGVGIPSEHIPRIFERFYVVDKSRTRSIGGTGLGLSIAKHIATLHGGRIEVTSIPYMGSTFTVSIPITYSIS